MSKSLLHPVATLIQNACHELSYKGRFNGSGGRMQKPSIIGVDLAKMVFQVHATDVSGEVAVKRQLPRSELLSWFAAQEGCLVGMEACGTAHYWARQIAKLGHDVRLLPPSYVKPYVRRQKNDRADAAAICEAVGRPSMRFASIKTPDQQAVQVLHRSRRMLVRQKIQLGNALRGHLAEFGIAFPPRAAGLRKAMAELPHIADSEMPEAAKHALICLVTQLESTAKGIKALDRQLLSWHRAQDTSRNLATIPGIGVMTATAIAGVIGDGRGFRSGRDFAAWLGLVPRQNSSGGKERLGRISKRGDGYLRHLLVVTATLQFTGKRRETAPGGAWYEQLRRRKHARVAAVAMANKLARIAWAVVTKGESYRATIPADEIRLANPADV
jgi:transposase